VYSCSAEKASDNGVYRLLIFLLDNKIVEFKIIMHDSIHVHPIKNIKDRYSGKIKSNINQSNDFVNKKGKDNV